MASQTEYNTYFYLCPFSLAVAIIALYTKNNADTVGYRQQMRECSHHISQQLWL